MLWSELLKIFKRKLNYIYTVISVVLLLGISILENTYFKNTDINKEEFIFNYNLKLILVMSIVFVVVNITYSYRKDYIDKIDKFIRFSKISRFYNLFSKILANYFIVFLFYILLTGIYIAVVYYTNGTDSLLNVIMKNNIVFSVVILFFVTNLALMIVVIFNNGHIAMMISILLLTMLTFIRDFLRNQYSMNLSGDIFSDSFLKISAVSTNLEISNIIQLLIYSICIFFISLIVKLIKNN